MDGAGHVMRQELGFRKSKEDSAIRLKEPHVDQEEYDARPKEPTCQPGFPPPVHPSAPLLAPAEDVPGMVAGAKATGGIQWTWILRSLPVCVCVGGGNTTAALFI